MSDRNWTRGLAIVTALLGLLQLIAIGFQVGIARKQNRIIERQNTIMAAQKTAAETQSGYMKDGLEETRKAANAAEASATIALAQKRIADKQLAQMDSQIEIARINAEAAKLSADTATLALHLTERADLVIDRIEAPTVGGDLVGTTKVVIWFKNRGRTRANNVLFEGTLGVPGGYEMPKEIAPPTVVAADDEVPYAFSHTLGSHIPPDALAKINAGQLELRITGLLTYNDIFDKPHTVKFQGHWHTEVHAFSPDQHESD